MIYSEECSINWQFLETRGYHAGNGDGIAPMLCKKIWTKRDQKVNFFETFFETCVILCFDTNAFARMCSLVIKTSFYYEQTRDRNVQRLIAWMTGASWVVLLLGLILSLSNLHHFSDRNVTLMAGLGCMMASVFLYIIRTAIHLVCTPADQIDSD